MGDFNSYFSSIPKMETERLIFTAFTREDMNAYFEILRDKDVQRYLGGGVPLFDKEPHISNWLNNINDKLLKRKLVFTWCIREKRSNQVIGRIDLGGFIKKQNAEISYHFAKAFWGGGLASEAVQIVTKFGMEELGLSRIQGMVMVDNQASVRVLEKNEPNIKALQGNALDIKLPDNSFDIVLLFGPMYHLISFEDKLKAINEAKRVLKPNPLFPRLLLISSKLIIISS